MTIANPMPKNDYKIIFDILDTTISFTFGLLMGVWIFLNNVINYSSDKLFIAWDYLMEKTNRKQIVNDLDNDQYAINYFKDKVEPNKKFKKPNVKEKKALENLVKKLQQIDKSLKPEEIQTYVYTIGKESGYEKNLREWFKLIYEVVFGEENGPRIGFFISFFGLNETIELINDKIKNN